MSKIELKHIDKFYGKNHVLKDLNLTIEDGDFMTLLGPSGCGKTTTLRVVSGLEKPQNGFIYMDGKEIPDSRMEKVMVVLGDGKLMPAAEQAIYGHRAGEVFRFDFTYPQDFRLPELSGKTAQFEIELRSLAEKVTPAPDEAFAKSLGFDSLDALKADLRAKKQKIHEEGADRAAGKQLLDMAGANMTVDLPAEILDRTAQNEMKLLKERLSRSGITLEQHCKNSRTTPEALEKDYRAQAESRIRFVLAAKAIAEQGLGVSSAPDDPLEQVAVTVHAVSIPVSFAKAWPTLKETIEATKPNIVIATGLKHAARGVMLERCATNLMDAIKPDADNVIPRREPIDPNGPAAYWTRLPLRSILNDFTDDSIPATLSSDAGTFVCNSLFYNLLNWTATQEQVLGGFVSFPPVVPAHSSQHGLPLDQQIAAGRDVVREAVRYYLKPSSSDILIA